MGFFRNLGEKIDAALSEDEKNELKGREFEKYVAKTLLPKKSFIIEDWTTDNLNKRNGIYVSSNTNPDFIITDRYTGKKFAIECKYRSEPYQLENSEKFAIRWSTDEQLSRYKAFEKERQIPIFIVIGCLGTPKKPNVIFAIPLSDLKYPIVYDSIFEKFDRFADKPFYYRNGLLL